MNSKIYLFGLSFVAAGLIACGDDVTKVYESESTGMEMLAAGKKLPECGTENQGALVYSYDSNAVFFCAKKGWKRFVEESEPVEASEAKSCSGKSIKNVGIEISCGGEVIDTLRNGSNGETGEGKDGKSCSGKSIKDVGIEISCGGKVVDTLFNAKAEKSSAESCTGKSIDGVGVEIKCGGKVLDTLRNGVSKTEISGGCIVTSDENGKIVINCDGTESTIYKAECNGVPYDPAKKFCLAGDVTDLKGKCGTSDIDLTKQFCDNDNKIAYKYTVVKYNGYEQIWMAEDLKVETTNSVESANGGRLYTWWDAVESMDDAPNPVSQNAYVTQNFVQGRCPDGWHIPSYDEAKSLADYDGLFNNNSLTNTGASMNFAYALRSVDWTSAGSAKTSTDELGFNAKASGIFTEKSDEIQASDFQFRMWTTRESVDGNKQYSGAISVLLTNSSDMINFTSESKVEGSAVRCLKNYR